MPVPRELSQFIRNAYSGSHPRARESRSNERVFGVFCCCYCFRLVAMTTEAPAHFFLTLTVIFLGVRSPPSRPSFSRFCRCSFFGYRSPVPIADLVEAFWVISGAGFCFAAVSDVLEHVTFFPFFPSRICYCMFGLSSSAFFCLSILAVHLYGAVLFPTRKTAKAGEERNLGRDRDKRNG